MTFLVCLYCPSVCYELHTDSEIGKLFPHILNEHTSTGFMVARYNSPMVSFSRAEVKFVTAAENATVMEVPSKLKETQQIGYRLLRVLESLFYGKSQIDMVILVIWRPRDLKPLPQCSWQEGIAMQGEMSTCQL